MRKPGRIRASAKSTARRRALSRGHVVQEALALLDRDGLPRFSVRRLADHLGVTPMALYNHVNSKRDLLEAVADQVVTQAEYRPAKDDDWQSIVRGCFRTLRQACLAHPGAMPVVESAEELPTAVFRPMEITLRALYTAGLRPQDAMRAYFVFMTFTLGQVKYQIKRWSRGVDRLAALSEGRISDSALPALAQATSGVTWDFNKFFEFGLSVLIEGLEARAKAKLKSEGSFRRRAQGSPTR